MSSSAACRAISSSSLVGITATVTGAPSGEISRGSSLAAVLRVGSIVQPSSSRPSATAARRAGLFSPTPAVKDSRSRPPSSAQYAPT